MAENVYLYDKPKHAHIRVSQPTHRTAPSLVLAPAVLWTAIESQIATVKESKVSSGMVGRCLPT